MFSIMVKECLSQKNLVKEHVNDIQEQLNKLEGSVSRATFLEDEDIPSILMGLTDLLICRNLECQNVLAPKAITILYKIAKNQFLLKELVQTYKIHIPLCGYFNTTFCNEDQVVNIPVLELLFAVNRVPEEPCFIKLTMLNLFKCLKKNRDAKIVLGCLRNYFVYSNLDPILAVDLDNEQIGYYINRLTTLCSSDDELKNLYARTIIIAAITKYYSFRKMLPTAMELFKDSLIVIANTISTKDPEIKEASFFLCKYFIENVLIEFSNQNISMDYIIKEVTKLDEKDCNPIATCELIQVFMTHMKKLCLKSLFNTQHDSAKSKDNYFNFTALKSWIERTNKTFASEGDLPLLALRLLSTIIKEYDEEILDLLKEMKLPSVLNKILQKKILPNNVIDAEFLNVQAACLNLISLLYKHQEMALFSKGLNHFMLAILHDNYALTLARNEKMKLTGLNIIIQTIFILDNTDDIFSPEVVSLLQKLKPDLDIEVLLASGLSSGSPILYDVCYNFIDTALRSERSSIDYASILQKIVQGKKSIESDDSTQMSCISSTLSCSSILDSTMVNDIESTRIERQLFDKDMKIKLLNKVILSMQTALNDASSVVANYSISQEVQREDNQRLQNEKTKCHNVIKALEEQLKVERACIRDIRAERDKMVKNQAEYHRELNTKDAALDDLGKKLKTMGDVVINYKHDVAKYQELLDRKKDEIEKSDSRISELEELTATIQTESEEKDRVIKDQRSTINAFEQEMKRKNDEMAMLKKDLEESKHIQETVMKLMSTSKRT